MCIFKMLFALYFILISLLIFTAGQELQLLKVNSLGRSARLGSLYNAKTEQFNTISIFSQNIPDSLIHKIGASSTNTKFGVSRSISERSQLLDVSLTLTLSAFWGLVSISGSAHFIEEETTKTNSVVGSLVYETRTVDEMIEMFFDGMKNHISHSMLNSTDDTHVVFGIGWGSNVVVKFEDLNIENRDVTTVQLEMGGLLNSVKSGAFAGMQHEEIEKFHQFSFKIFGDLSLEDKDYPADVTKVLEFIQNVPRLLESTNGGKGKEMHFYLMPLQRIRDYVNNTCNSTFSKNPISFETDLDLTVDPDLSSFDLPADEAASQIQLLEQQSIVRLKLNELATAMRNHRNFINNSDLHKLTALESSFKTLTTSYKNQMKKSLLRIRATMRNGKFKSNSKEWIKSFQGPREDTTSSLEAIENSIDIEFRPLRLKLDLVSLIQSQGMFWLGRGEFLDSTVIKIFKTFGLKMSICAVHFYQDFIHENEALDFVSAVVEGEQNKTVIPIVIDCDFSHDTCQSLISREKKCTLLYHGLQGDEKEEEEVEEKNWMLRATKALNDWKKNILADSQNAIHKKDEDFKSGSPSRLLGTQFTGGS